MDTLIIIEYLITEITLYTLSAGWSSTS